MENPNSLSPIERRPDQLRQRIEGLQRQISELEAFDCSLVKARGADETRALQAEIAKTLAKTFGKETPDYKHYASAARLDNGPIYLSGRPPVELVVEWINEGKAMSLALLRRAVVSLQAELTKLGDKAFPDHDRAAEDAGWDFATDGQNEAKVKIETNLRLISAAALFLSTCVLIFHGRKVKSNVRKSAGTAFCKKCGASISISNASAIKQDFSATCPDCQTTNTYKRTDFRVA
jgi:hypothetical protein